MTETGKKLMELLRGIYDDHDFVCGTMSNCGNEDSWTKMTEFITFANEHGESVSPDDILALSLSLGERSAGKKSWFDRHKGMIATL